MDGRMEGWKYGRMEGRMKEANERKGKEKKIKKRIVGLHGKEGADIRPGQNRR